jgi:sensor domain CHASE-containing protein
VDNPIKPKNSLTTFLKTKIKSSLWFWRRSYATVRQHPLILVWTLATFAALCAIGITVTLLLAETNEADHREEARQIAIQSGNFFSEQLDRAILPLFSLAQFVYELDIFLDLPKRIGESGTPGAVPLLPPKTEGGVAMYRNATGVCDDPELVSRFNDIASTIKRNAGMEGVLVNLQLAPVAVVCLAYPLNNTEDFPSGLFLDNTAIIGHDLLLDPVRKFIAKTTLPGTRIVTAGPVKLMQCENCDPAVEKAFIARLPIAMDKYNITVDGEVYQRWGFATALINWKALVERSMIYDQFRENGLDFRLTRTDKKLDTATGEYFDEDVILAESANFKFEGESQTEFVELQTTDNLWRMTVGSVSGFHSINVGLIIAAVVAASLIISLMLLLILVENHAHRDLLREILPPCALRKIQNGETVVEQYDVITVFFSDIIGYTSMAADMSPIAVMEMLNKFYSEMDRLADKHQVYKIETIGGKSQKSTVGSPNGDGRSSLSCDYLRLFS